MNTLHWIGKSSFMDQPVTSQPNEIQHKGSVKLEPPTVYLSDIKLSMGEKIAKIQSKIGLEEKRAKLRDQGQELHKALAKTQSRKM
jgi:hypothetical protein